MAFHIALVHPEIPQNTGNIGRLCLALDATLHLVHPLAFDISERAVRRAGLDYWKHVRLVEHQSLEHFWEWVGPRRFYLFSSTGQQPYTRVPFADDDVYVFGRETVGLPRELLSLHPSYLIPMVGDTRSLNLANSVAIVAYRALSVLKPELF